MFEPDPLTFFKKNKIPGTFSDHVFLTYCTITLGHDLIILRSLKENGGCDVSAMLGLASTVSEQVDDTLGTTFNPSFISTSRKRRRSPEPNGDTMEQELENTTGEQEENPTSVQPVNTIEEQEEYPTTEQEENTTSEQVTLEESTKVTLTPPPPTPPFVYRPLVNGLADVTLTSPVPQPPALQPPAPSVMIPPILIRKTASSWSSVDVSLFIN